MRFSFSISHDVIVVDQLTLKAADLARSIHEIIFSACMLMLISVQDIVSGNLLFCGKACNA